MRQFSLYFTTFVHILKGTSLVDGRNTWHFNFGSRRSSLPKKKKKRAEEELNEYKRDGEEVKWTARSLRVPKVLPNKKSNEIRLIFSLIPVLLLFYVDTSQ